MANIIGVGSTKFGEHWTYGLRDMICYASSLALKSANLELKDIDSLFVSNCFSSTILGQNNFNAVCADELGIPHSVLIGGGDASGAYAIAQAANSIKSGESKIVLVLGVEKMSDFSSSEIAKIASEIVDQDFEAYNGATLAGLYAMITLRHMKEYGTTNEHLDLVSVKNHFNASENEIAQFKFKISKEDVAKSPIVASPIRVLHSAAPSDGCSALIMCNDDFAKNFRNKIKLISNGFGNDYLAVHERESITSFNSLSNAAKSAFAKSKLKINDISFAEVHDSFSIAEIISIEDLGLAKKGEGGKFIEDGNADISGKFPINPSGGLKGCGHPYGATGVRQAIECFNQLNNMTGKRQVKNPKYALTSTLSGTGATAVVNIFSR